MAQLLDGKKIANQIKDKIKTKIASHQRQGLPVPGLAVILVGHDPASQVYVRNKCVACETVGMISHCHRLPVETSQKTLCTLIDTLNADTQVHGILLQLPLPPHLDSNRLLERILPSKDVDGFHPYNLGRLAQRRPLLSPCTPHGIITLLKHYDLPFSGMDALVVGASNIVGRPMMLELLLEKATVTIAHRFTKNLAVHVRQADLLIVAVGKPGIIQSDWIKPDAIVVDVGINRQADGRIVGDVDFESAGVIAGWITPVPGGVGPMTIATLLENTLLATELS